ncbi:phage portal protein [Streptomyces sp. Z26]|uniref:phage portal protein n=1 Tax=Streptomyces sp. Z26 TaxID=2500177 RepID=UPI001F0B77D6|nr:phage portal protein [Streptomyces sp. Z26]
MPDGSTQLADDDRPEVMIRKLRARLSRREEKVKEWNDLYEGERPLKYASPEFAEQTGGLFEDFSDNWCKTVPDTLRERLSVVAFHGEDGTPDKEAGRAWRRNGADVEVGLAILDALVVARSHGLVWNTRGESDITFIPAGQAIVDYVPGTRGVRRAGLRVWSDGSHEFATLFVRASAAGRAMAYRRQRALNGGEWVARTVGVPTSEPTDLINPTGLVPLVEIANRARLHGSPQSEIAAVAPLQDAVNTLWAHLFTAADFAALPQRVVLGMDKPTKDLVDPETGDIIGEEDVPLGQYSRDRLLWLSKAGAAIGQFAAADLDAYLKVISQAVRHIAAQTRTPPQYLLGEMANIAADALEAAESGLVAKAKDRQLHFGADLREIMRLEALVSGDPARAQSLAMGRTVWRDAQFRSEAQYADVLTKYKAIGVPDEALWRMIPDVDPEQIDEWVRLRDTQAQAAAQAAAQAFSSFGPKDAEDGGEEDEAEAA